ncbi:MAG: glycosyltransferase family 2 protein [Eubacterium sp.]|nr:glycosyltransferase family 2 protein [Eubacterium sp.]
MENREDILYIIIPAYNEEENILRIIEGWYPVIEAHSGGGASRLVIIDDGSTDNTMELLTECACARPYLTVLTKENQGHGASVLYGYRYAIEKNADYVFQTDADGQTLPSEFEAFWQERAKYDLVIGWRKDRQDGRARIFVTDTLRYVIRKSFGVEVADANTPYRLMESSVLKEVLKLVPENYFLSNVILTVIYTKQNRRILYIPITFRPRQGGTNSINMKKIFRIGRKALKEFREINRAIEAEQPASPGGDH